MRPPRETGLVTGVVVAPTYAAGGVSRLHSFSA
jgi:hypothetical protein